jgi:Fic family protein
MTPQMASTVQPDTPDASTSSVVQRIRGEYMEMPGLTLTVRQAARLWGLEIPQSRLLLSELVESRFLVKDSGGAYRRRGCPRCS